MGDPLTLIDKGSRRLGPDARLLLCSDGVQSLERGRDRRRRRSSRCAALIEAVLAAAKEHQDNVTVIKLERER